MKVLCVCQRGNSRSVALAYLLKEYQGHNAIPIGIETAGDEAKDLLFKWADKIVVTDKRIAIPAEFHSKVKDWDVGADRFFRGFEPELLQMFVDYSNNDPL